MEFFRSRTHLPSAQLATEGGVFPAYRGSWLQTLHQRQRNATVTAIAPTGGISLIADCSPGIEPLYGVQEVHHFMDGIVLTSLLQPLSVARAHSVSISLTPVHPGNASFHSTFGPFPRTSPSTGCHSARCLTRASCAYANRVSAIWRQRCLKNHQFACHGDQTRGGRGLSPHISTRMQRPHCLQIRQSETTSLFLQPLASLLNLAAHAHNFSTKLTPLHDGGTYFHRLAHVGSNRSVWR